MTSREEILADFQACTGIEDVGLAISTLEDAGWVLVDAVNKALPGSPPSAAVNVPAAVLPERSSPEPIAPIPPTRTDSMEASASAQAAPSMGAGPLPSASTAASTSPTRVEEPSNPFLAFQSAAGASRVPVSMAEDFYNGPSTSSYAPRFRMLDFIVTHGDKSFSLKVPDNEDVKTLKTLIQNETGCPPCQQSLRGFKGSSSLPPIDRRRLSELNLPKQNLLHLTTPDQYYPDADMANGEEKEAEGQGEDIRLIITNETNNESYTLNFRRTHTVLSVKLDVSNLTDIPVSKQVWTGWPEGTNDELSLAQVGVQEEQHLTVDRAAPAPHRDMPVVEPERGSSGPPSRTNSQSRRSGGGGGGDAEDESDDDFEDASSEVVMDDDEFFGGGSAAAGSSSGGGGRRMQSLIPDDYGDEVMASLKFAEEFAGRYGTPHPNFFPGTLSDAIRESCQQPAKKRKMLAIYLHHDSSVLSNVFCTQALCSDSVVAFLEQNFVTFGWDVTHHSNKKRCIQMITDHFGSIAASTLRNLDIEKFPLLALAYKLRGTIEIYRIVHGNVSLDELMSELLGSTESYHAQLSVEIQEDEEREARDAVKREQDLAFEMAQQADKEKDEQREREERQRREQERREEEERQREEQLQRRLEREREEERRRIASRLPAEPADDVRHARIRFRSVEKGQFERRFLPGDRLQVLFDYLASQGFPTDEHKVLSSWPRRDLTCEDPNRTMEELKLFPQETLTLEEK